MTYAHERDEFIARATREGLNLATTRKLLRYASTLQRLAVAQCNGDWPYQNGTANDPHGRQVAECPECKGWWVLSSFKRSTVQSRTLVCSDCRTQELVTALLATAVPAHDCRNPQEACPHNGLITAIFGGDPRGAVLRLSTPNYPYDESGRNGARGLYVPARAR